MPDVFGRPDNTEEGYKCSHCGHMWTGGETVDHCPVCGAT